MVQLAWCLSANIIRAMLITPNIIGQASHMTESLDDILLARFRQERPASAPERHRGQLKGDSSAGTD